MADKLLFFIVTFFVVFSDAVNLVHFDITTSHSNDEYKVNFKYKENFNFNVNVKHSNGTYLLEGKCDTLNSYLNGEINYQNLTQSSVLYVGSIDGNIDTVNISYKLFVKTDKCPTVELNHTLTTSPIDLVTFSSTLTGNCNKDDSLNLVSIVIDLDGKLTPLLKTRLDQIFVFEDDRMWEEMTMSNTFIDINVKADWPGNKYGYKRATFKSKLFQSIPSFTLEYLKSEEEIILKLIKSLVQNEEKDEL